MEVEQMKELLAKKERTLPWQRATDLPALAIAGANRTSIVQTPNQNAWNHFGPANNWDGVNGEDTLELIVAAVNALPELLKAADETQRLLAENERLRAALGRCVKVIETFQLDPYFSMWGGDEALAAARLALKPPGGER